MPDIDQKRAARVRASMELLLREHGGARSLSKVVRLSEPTIRRIAETGVVTSHATAAKIVVASPEEMTVDDVVQPNAKGDVYRSEPGLSILQAALRDKVSVSDVLTRIGIDHHDLWAFMNNQGGNPGELRNRVQSAIDRSGIVTAPEASK